MRSFQVVAGQNALAQQLTNLRADALGAANLLVHQQLGALALGTAPTNGQTVTLTINGTAIIFTAVGTIGSTPGNVLNPGTAAGFVANLLALLRQPQTTTSTGVALSAANQLLLGYLSWPSSGTTITPCSNNTSLYSPLSSFTASTTVTSGSWTAQTMQLYVEPGVVYVAGTRVIFSGGSTPTVSAPSSNPRIDVLTVDGSGVLAWTTGAENASPVAPTYPANKVALCELYNVVSETALYDNANQHTSQGYIYYDVRPTVGSSINLGAVSSDILPDADGTRNLGSLSFQWNNVYAKSGIFVNGVGVASAKFGGNGADGALSISSGTTTINCAGAAVVVKNYTSISITGTGVLAFSNPNANGTIVILKSQGNVTLTSSATPMIDMSGMGAAGGAGNANTSGNDSNGSAGTGGLATIYKTNQGTGGIGNTQTAGTDGSIPSFSFFTALTSLTPFKYPFVGVGAGGGGGGVKGGGSSNVDTPGTGGRGGGGLVIECGGAWNFTTSSGISVAGKNGTASSRTSGSGGEGGGGGGGGGGFFVALYASLTANSGTVTVSGGSLGNFTGSSNATAGGGGGGITAAGSSGAGGAGFSLVAANTEFS